MAGTKIGGQKAAAKNLANDPNFYAKIGAKGGQNGTTGGFAAAPEIAVEAGRKGGHRSKRGYRFSVERQGILYYHRTSDNKLFRAKQDPVTYEVNFIDES